MKKLIVFAAFTLISFKVAAQETTTKEIEKFTEIKAFDRISVILIQSNENKVVLTGEDQGDVDIENKKGLLKIKMDFENSMDGEDVEAKVYYTEELTLIDANEGARITSDGAVKASESRIAVQEGGKIELTVDIENLFVKSTSGSEVTLTGKATNQEVVANAGGKVYNENLDTETTKVTVNAGGSAEIKASILADAKVRAGGAIAIHGNPKKIERDKVFGGKIEVIE